MKWSENTGRAEINRRMAALFCGMVSTFICGSVMAAGQDQAAGAGVATYMNNIQGKTSSGENVYNNFVSPMVSSGKINMLNGDAAFGAPTFQNSGQKFLQVSVGYNQTDGTLSGIEVSQALSPTSIGWDYNYSVPSQTSVSGVIPIVCSDGYAVCPDANSYNPSTCSFWKWAADPTAGSVVASNLHPGTVLTYSIADLSGCYCFSNHCTKQAASSLLNLDSIVDTVGGAALSALLEKVNYAVSSTKGSPGQISYYGVKTETPVKPVNDNKEVVYSQVATSFVSAMDSDGQVTAAANADIDTQKKKPKSIFNIVNNAVGQQGTGLKNVECHDLVEGKLDLNTYTKIQTGQRGENGTLTTSAVTPYIAMQVLDESLPAQGIYGLAMSVTDDANLKTTKVTDDCRIKLDNTNSTGYELVNLEIKTVMDCWNSVPDPKFVIRSPAGKTKNIMGATNLPSTITPYICHSTKVDSNAYFIPALVDCTLTATYKSQDYSQNTVFGCKTFEDDPKCTLLSEWLDYKPTVIDHLATGFELSEECRTFKGPLKDAKVCNPWWDRKRIYECKTTPTSWNISKYKDKVKKIQDSAKLDGDVMTYTDINSNGTTINMKTNVLPEPDKTVPSCEPTCKTKIKQASSKMSLSGPASEIQSVLGTAKDKQQYAYYPCLPDMSGTYTCPAKEDETIVKQCTCLNEFGEAVGALGAIGKAAGDSICSKN